MNASEWIERLHLMSRSTIADITPVECAELRAVLTARETEIDRLFTANKSQSAEILRVHDALHRTCTGPARLDDEIRELQKSRDSSLAALTEANENCQRIARQNLVLVENEREACAKAIEATFDCAEHTYEDARAGDFVCARHRAKYAAVVRARGGQ